VSIESTINSIISQMRSLASSSTATTNQMVSNAVGFLEYNPSYPSSRAGSPRRTGVSNGRSGNPEIPEKVPSFPGIRLPNFPNAPSLGEIGIITARFTAEEPTITLPAMNYSFPAEIDKFNETTPDIDTALSLPTRPTLEALTRPTYVDVDTNFPIDNITVPQLNITRPTYTPGTLAVFEAEFENGLSKIPDLEEYAHRILDQLFPGLRANYAALSERVAGILEGRETALTDRQDQALYDQLRARVAQEREKNLQAVDEAALQSGWELPGAARLAARMRVETESSRSLNQAALEVYTKRAERELQHLQFVMNLAATLHGAGMDLFTKALGLNLEAFRAALAYADSAVEFSAKVYELRQRDYEIAVSLLEAEIKIFEARLRAELAKLEVTRNRIEVEKLKTDINQQLLNQYLGELKAQESQVQIYVAEIQGLRAELDARKFPLDIFQAQVESYVALTNAKRGEYEALRAQIDGDKAKIDGELAKVRVYESQANVYKTKVDGESAAITARAKRNDQLLDVYRTRVQSELALVQTDEAIAKHSLNAYEAMAKIYIAQSEMDLKDAELDFRQKLEDARMKLENLKFDFQSALDETSLEMNRRKALADTNLSAGNVQGGLANSALSALNSVVSLAATQE
jgi:predicted GNAT family acetyltransferase